MMDLTLVQQALIHELSTYPTMDLTLVQQALIHELSNKLKPMPLTFLNEDEFQDILLHKRVYFILTIGRHYELYRTVVQNGTLLHLHAAFAIQTFRHGFILERWRQIIQGNDKENPQPIAV
jgi:hypothetical protein